MTTLTPERIFYDGDCGVCHGTVVFIARRDRDGQAFRFAPLGGEAFMRTVPAPAREALPDSVVVQTRDGRLLVRTTGLIYILRRLGGVWPWVGRLLAVIPRPLRDWGYDAFARIRHRLRPRPTGVCPLVPPAWRGRFEA